MSLLLDPYELQTCYHLQCAELPTPITYHLQCPEISREPSFKKRKCIANLLLTVDFLYYRVTIFFIVIIPVKGTTMQIKKYRVVIASIEKINPESFALVLFMILELYTFVVFIFHVLE